MFNIDEINQITFEKVVRGYRVEDVDSFVEKVAEEIDLIKKEKQEIEAQLYILAEKIEQYKTEEESIKATLINAQKLGESIIAESRQKAEAILKDANIRKNDILASAHEEFALYEENLARVKKEVSEFKLNVLGMYKEHIESLSKVPEIKKEPAASVEEEIGHVQTEFTQNSNDIVIDKSENNTKDIESTQQFSIAENKEEIKDKFNNISSLFE